MITSTNGSHHVIGISDGTVRIMFLVEGFNVEDEIKKWPSEDNSVVFHRPHENGELPDEYFRNAWTHENGKVIIHMDKARNIKMTELRLLRNKKLSDLDIEYQKALEAKDSALQDSIAAKKKALRDLPDNNPLTDLIDIQSLKYFLPSELK